MHCFLNGKTSPMNLAEIDDLTFFDAVARASSLTAAAREWGVSVAAVSKRLTRLEARLGAQLLTRTTRSLMLTDEGARYAAGASAISARIRALEGELVERRGEMRGTVSVHATMGLGRLHIAPLLGAFRDRHPGIDVDLELSPLPLNIAGSAFDVGIRVGRVQDSRLGMRVLAPNRRIVCASPCYLASHGIPRTPHDLEAHRCIVIRQDENDFALWRFGAGERQLSVRVNGGMISNDGEAATRWCVDGHGLLLRSLWHVAPLLASGELVPVLEAFPTPPADIHAVHRANARMPLRVSLLLDFLREQLPARLAAAPA